MSSEWDLGDEQGDDVYRRMWEDVDQNWTFDALNDDDWAAWNQAIGDGASANDLTRDEHPSSSIFLSSPQRPSRTSPSPPRPTSTYSHDAANRSHSLTAMGNASSSANNVTSQLQETSQPQHPHHTANIQRRLPAADHREDWLDHTTTERPSEFGYIAEGLFQGIQTPSPHTSDTGFTSDGIDIDDILNTGTTDTEAEDMPSTRRRHQNGNSVVDLTQDSSPPAQSTESLRPSRSRKRSAEASSQGRASKRSKRSPNTAAKVDELDLTNEAPSAEEELLQAQQQEAILAQQQAAEEANEGPLKIGRRQCIICMENFTNATIAHCGHIYCHECLTQALLAGEKNSERGVGNCPVCRKPVKRTAKSHIIPINFMKKSTFKGKARRDAALLA